MRLTFMAWGQCKMEEETYFCDLEELTDSRFLIRSLGGKSIGCIRVKGEVICILNYCPHEGAEICLGYVGRLIKQADVGCVEYDPEKTVIVCPWHKWEFCTSTGEPVVAGAGRVRIFAHTVREGKVFILSGRGLSRADVVPSGTGSS